MRILIDAYLAFVSRGGISNYIINLSEGLKKHNFSVKIIIFSHPFNIKKVKEKVKKEKNYTILPMPLRAIIGFSGSLFLPCLEWFEKFGDIYHATCGISIPSRKKIILTIHDLTFIKYPSFVKPSTRRFYLSGVKKSLNYADAVIVPSNTTKRDLIHFYGYPEKKIYAIPMDSQFKNLKLREEIINVFNLKKGKYFLFIGNVERRKNIINLIKGFEKFKRKNKDFKLVLAGGMGWDREYYHKIKNFIQRYKIKDIIFTGEIGKEELYTLLKYSKSLLLVSHYEGFGIPVVEAMKEGIPVIVSSSGALPEIAGDAGIYVNKDDPDDIAEKMELICQDENIWNTFSKKGKKRGKIFSWDITIKKTIEVYKQVLR